jgi:hypothetical protein
MNGGAGAWFLCCSQVLIVSVAPDALKIPARRAEYSLTESARSPFQAEPTHFAMDREWCSSNPASKLKVRVRVEERSLS